MNYVVWKFPFEIKDTFSLKMPAGSRILHVALQGDVPCMWALCKASNPEITRQFRIHGTGHSNIELDEIYVGTIMDGAFVWHIFEVR